MRIRALLTSFFALLVIACATAETIVHPIGIEVTFPDRWEVETHQDEVVVLHPSEPAGVALFVRTPEDAEDQMRTLIEDLSDIMDDVKVTSQGEKGTLNGLDATFVEGTGSGEGKALNWIVSLVEYQGRIVMVIGFAESSKWDPKTSEVVAIIRSVRPR